MTDVFTSWTDVQMERVDEVFCCPTDTVYGLSTSVHATESIAKIKTLKGKDPAMPLIVLIGSLEHIALFTPDNGVSVTRLATKLWPGPVSIVFPNVYEKWNAVSPNGTLALRLPDHPELQAFLNRVGPIVSTSANKTGQPPCETIAEVMAVFPELSFVVDTGPCRNPPSTLIKVMR
jgi:L-threonylcarbamoyladenylate synthase